jgi:hypothetical protein
LFTPALVVRARDQLAAIIDRIVVKEIDKCEHEMEIIANPAAVFSLIDPAVGERLATESSIRMVAGEGYGLWRTVIRLNSRRRR